MQNHHDSGSLFSSPGSPHEQPSTLDTSSAADGAHEQPQIEGAVSALDFSADAFPVLPHEQQTSANYAPDVPSPGALPYPSSSSSMTQDPIDPFISVNADESECVLVRRYYLADFLKAPVSPRRPRRKAAHPSPTHVTLLQRTRLLAAIVSPSTKA